MVRRIIKLTLDRLVQPEGLFYLILAIFLTVSVMGSAARMRRISSQVDEARADIERLEEESAEYQKELEVIRGDAFIEKQIRDKLGLAKEGEIVIVLPEEEVLKKLAPPRVREEDFLPDPNWKKWLDLFL